MMKKFFFFVSFLACSLVASATVGDLFVVEGIKYQVSKEGTSPQVKVVLSPNADGKYSGSIVIPSTVANGSTTYTVTEIDGSAFSGSTALTQITFPATLTKIGASAFYNCSSLQGALVLPNSVTTLGASAFQGCSALTSVSIPSSVTSFGTKVFLGCTSLTAVTFDENCRATINHSLFRECSSLTEISIPDNVTKIDQYAFYGCTNLEKVTIGSGVTSLGTESFSNCTNLKTVTLKGNALTTIDYKAFQYCTSLEAFPLQEGITTIKGYAFSGCTGVKGTLTIPNTVTEIANHAFTECSGLESVVLPSSITTLGSSVFRLCTGLTTVQIDENFSLGIPSEMFERCYALQTITIPDNVPSIGQNAFHNCTTLVSATIGRKVETIDRNAFKSCEKLQTIDMQSACLKSIGATAFYQCKALTGITFPETLTSIGESAFEECTSLKHISLPGNITTLGTKIFQKCTGLLSVTFDENFSIGISNNMFHTCSALETVNIPNKVSSIGNYAFYKTNLSSVAVGSGVTSIGNNAFSACTNLKTLDLSNSTALLTIGGGCCDGSSNLTGELIIPDNVISIGEHAFRMNKLERVTLGENLQTISDNVFYQCRQLTSITFGEKIQTIGKAAFRECQSLASPITLPATLTSVGERAFISCGNIPSVTFANSAATIGMYAFHECSNLTSLDLGNGITQIADYAFNNCKKLTGKLIIPNSVTSIGTKAFYNCAGITAIQLGSNVTALGEEAFRGIPNITTPVFNDHIFAYMPPTYQPNGAGQLYDYTIQDGTKIIASYAFDACNYLQSVIIPNSVHTIGNYAFRNCTELLVADIPVTVENIGEGIFEGCSKMNKPFIVGGVLVFMPDSYLATNCQDGIYRLSEDIHGIAGRAFNNCVHLKEIIIHNNLTEIGSDAFSGCTNLATPVANDVLFAFLPRHYQGEVVIKEGVKTIAPYAFANCTGLTKITIPSTLETSLINVFTGCTGLTSVVWNVPRHADFETAASAPFYSMRQSITSFTFGDKVEHIPAYLCNEMAKLTSISIPQHVTSIGTKAFTGCTGIRAITWQPIQFTIAGHLAAPFYDIRKNITSFTFGDAVEQIPNALCNEMKLTEVTIPATVKTIENEAFSQCTALTKVNHTGDAATWCNIQFSSQTSHPLYYAKRLYFNNQEVTALVIPETVTTIHPRAFANAENIQSVVIGNGVTTIGENAFYGCSNLQSLTVGENVATVATSALTGCSKLTSVVWNVKHCADFNRGSEGIFHSLRNQITSFTFGDAVEHIPAYLCYEMKNLTNLTIPQGLKTMGAQTFYGTSITDITWHPKQFENLSTVSPFNDIASNITSFTFGDAVEYIPSNLCYNMTHLNTTVIPRSVKSVGERAFGGCTGLQTTIYAGDVASWCNIQFASGEANPLLNAKNWFINSNEQVTDLVIPASVTAIGQYAFYNFVGLKAVTLSGNISSIGQGAFYNCIAIERFTIGEGVTAIDANAFKSCNGLKEVVWLAKHCDNFAAATDAPFYDRRRQITSFTFGDKVENIPSFLCYEMNQLTEISIPQSVHTIGQQAFLNCTKLTKANYAGDITGWCGIQFDNESANPLYHAKKLYFNDSPVTDITIPANLSHIGQYAFYNGSGIATVRVESESALPTVGSHAFTSSITGSAILYVPCPLQRTVNTTAPWSDFTHRNGYLAYITVEANNPTYGTVSVVQPDCDGNAGVITATANKGYHFVAWSDGNTENPRTLTPDADITLTAIFNPLMDIPTGDNNLGDLVEDDNTDLTAYDIVIANGATLICDVTTTVKNITIQAGGKLVVSNGNTLTVTEMFTAQSKDDEQPQILTEGTGAIAYGDFQFVKQIPADRYYFFSLPFESETSTVTIDNGKGGQKSAVYNSDWNYLYYDGAGFAQNPSNDSYWMDAPKGTIKPNQGYAVGVDAATADTYRELVFKPTAGETIDFSLNQAYSIAVAENPLRDDYVHPDKETFKGWNFIMNPYTSDFSAAVGSLSTPYVTIPDPGQSQTYTQKLFDAITLPPFFGFFVQVNEAGTIDFNPDNATNSTVKPFAAPSASRTTHNAPRYVGITLSNGEQEDETTLVIGEQYTTDYEIGSDLMKMIGYGNKPQVYTYHGSTKYAFKSINEATAAQVQPMGVYLPATGTYTFSLRDKHVAQAVYLYDYEANTCTNLVEMDYTFTSGRLNSEKRFAISAAFAPSQTTALPSADATAAFTVHQDGDLHITLQGVAAGDDIRIINVHGQVVMQWTAMDTTTEAELPQAGLYIIERTCAAGVEVNKIILQ